MHHQVVESQHRQRCSYKHSTYTLLTKHGSQIHGIKQMAWEKSYGYFIVSAKRPCGAKTPSNDSMNTWAYEFECNQAETRDVFRTGFCACCLREHRSIAMGCWDGYVCGGAGHGAGHEVSIPQSIVGILYKISISGTSAFGIHHVMGLHLLLFLLLINLLAVVSLTNTESLPAPEEGCGRLSHTPSRECSTLAESQTKTETAVHIYNYTGRWKCVRGSAILASMTEHGRAANAPSASSG